MAGTPDAGAVSLDAATVADRPLLENLLELYIHDLSAAFPSIELGVDGRFGYPHLPLYWSEPERRFAFIIRYGKEPRVAGFVLAKRGSAMSDDPNVLDVAEFFVLRRFRRSGVGRQAARLLWQRLPGTWIVRASHGNHGASPFWAQVITEYSGGTATEVTRPGTPHAWQVFSFESQGRPADA